MSNTLRAVVVGCRMGRHHAEALTKLKEFNLVALCDLKEETARSLSDSLGVVEVYTDYAKMLQDIQPDVVVIATPNNLHAPMTLQALNYNVKGIYCEKPMAVSLKEARSMQESCKKKNVKLVIGHQRRMSSVYRKMRSAIESGEIGEVYLVRGSCAGDILSDGTHTIDSTLYLLGDEDIKWVLGQVYRGSAEPPEVVAKNPWAYTGNRYGHLVERGAMAVFETLSGVRAEILTGDMRFPGRTYQDIEVIGTKGRLWRAGDSAEPKLIILKDNETQWKKIDLSDDKDVFEDVFRAFAESIELGSIHPLCSENSLRGFQVIMAIYESARLNARINLPLQQEEFPLDIMVREGRL